MKKVKTVKKWGFYIFALFLSFNAMNLVLPTTANAQEILEMDLKDLEDVAEDASKSTVNIVQWIGIAIFALGLLFVIWQLLAKKPHAYEWLIGYIVALIFFLVFFKKLKS